MRQLTRLLILAVALSAPGCGLIDAAGDSDGDGSGNPDGDGIVPHVMTFDPPVDLMSSCSADVIDQAEFIVDVDTNSGDVLGDFNPTGTSTIAVIEGTLTGVDGSGSMICDPTDSDGPFLTWVVSGSPEDGFSGTYDHEFDDDGDVTLEAE